jgi:anti-anti-sigma factor
MINNPLLEERKVYTDKGLIFIKLSPHLEYAQTQEFKQLFTKEFDDGNFRFVLNMSNVSFIYSAQVGVLWTALKQTRTKDGDIRLSELTDAVKTAFRSLNLQKSIRFYDSDEQAIASFDR